MAYFSNGSAGAILDNQCADCPLGEKACPVFLVQSIYNYKQFTDGEPNMVAEILNALVSEEGECQQRKVMMAEAPTEQIDPKKVAPWVREWMEKHAVH